MSNEQHTHSHIFTNRDGNTLMKEFEGVLQHNPFIRNLDAVVGFLRASGYFSLRPKEKFTLSGCLCDIFVNIYAYQYSHFPNIVKERA